jgi:hypothetical protein
LPSVLTEPHGAPKKMSVNKDQIVAQQGAQAAGRYGSLSGRFRSRHRLSTKTKKTLSVQ